MLDQWFFPKRFRSFRILFVAIMISLLLNGCGEQKPKIYRVGILSGSGLFAGIADGFKEEMTRLGYVEGKNIEYDLKKVKGNSVEGDLILAFPTSSAVAAKAATQGTNLPVVFAMANIKATALVKSISQPGGNLSGVRYQGPENTVKRLEILNELVPHAKRIWIIYDPNYPTIPATLEVLRPSAVSLGLKLIDIHITSVEDIRAGLQKRALLGNIDMDAILIMPELLSQSPAGWAVINEFAKKHKMPIGGSTAFSADHGAVFSYVPDPIELGKLAARHADKILTGTPTGTIPVVTAENHLRLNYKAAQELGLTVPEGLLRLASEIIR